MSREAVTGELVRAMALSFGPSELHRFAKGFGVLTDQEGSPEAGARLLVGALARRGELAKLIERLRERKPDLTWPDAPAEAAPEPSPVAAEPEPPPPPVAPIEPETPSRNGRLALGAALLLGGALVGTAATYFLLRERKVEPKEEGRAALALLAADELGLAVAAVARACEAETGAISAREALAEAFRRCAQPEPLPSARALVPDPFVAPDRRAPPPERPLGAPPRRPATGDPCLEGCRRDHEQCQANDCGPEPAGGPQFEAYQRCLSGCLAKSSRCRLRCG